MVDWNGANGVNGANGTSGEATASASPSPTERPAEASPPTEEAPDRTAEPTPRPSSREHGWRALPPRGARARADREESAPPTTPGPPASQPAPWPPMEDAPELPAEPATPLAWAPQRPPSAVVAPNGHAPFRPEVRGALGPLIDSLHELFARDRAIASQGNIARCGICYLHHPLDELEYREAEGFYVCQTCLQALGRASINMIRRQQR